MLLNFTTLFMVVFGYKIGMIDYSILLSGIIVVCLLLINPVKSNFIYIPKELYTVSVILAVISVIGILSFFVNNGDFLPEYILKPIRNIISNAYV